MMKRFVTHVCVGLLGLGMLSGCDMEPDEDAISRIMPVNRPPEALEDAPDRGLSPVDIADDTTSDERVAGKPVATIPKSTMVETTQQAAQGQQPKTDGVHAQSHADAMVKQAVVSLVAVGDSGVDGAIHLEMTDDGLHVHGEVMGLSPGKHGFHVHQFGDLTDREKGESAGGHFDPAGHPHGKPDGQQRHAGDFGNIEAGQDGKATIDFVDPVAELNGPNGILGRAIVIHAGEDKFTQPSGDAGPRVAFGVIGVANTK